MVALLHALAVGLRRRDRKLDLELAALELPRQLEARRLEDAEHAAVLGQHLGEEALDAHLGGALGELLEQARADPVALVRVGHGERRLGEGGVAQARIAPEGDDALPAVLCERPDECAPLVPVGLEQRLDELRAEHREAVEAQVEAALGQALEEPEHGRGVLPARRAETERAPVPEDDVDVVGLTGERVPGGGSRHEPRPDSPSRDRKPRRPAASGVRGGTLVG